MTAVKQHIKHQLRPRDLVLDLCPETHIFYILLRQILEVLLSVASDGTTFGVQYRLWLGLLSPVELKY